MINNKIITELNTYNKSYTLEIYQKDRMSDITKNLNDSSLESGYKYELALNSDFLHFNGYDKLEESIISWIDLNKFMLTTDELLLYINKRLLTHLSIDRIYFFNEMRYYYCPQKEKKNYAIKLIKSLKNCLLNKLENNSGFDLILRLVTRFLIITERFHIEEIIFINNILENYLCKLNVNQDFYISIHFYEFIFNKYNNKSYFYDTIVSFFEKFANKIDLELINYGYNPYREYGSSLAIIFKRINNYNQKLYFYKKEIDNALLECNDMKTNTMVVQSYVNYAALISKKINNYKAKEIKLLFQKVSKYISEHNNRLFAPLESKELEQSNLEYYKSIESLYNKTSNTEEKLDFVIWIMFYESFNVERFNQYLKDKKVSDNGFLSPFFNNQIIIDPKGFSYNIEDNDKFTFFKYMTLLQNNLFLYLDHCQNWIKMSEDIVFEDIENLKLIKAEYKNQFKITIESFYKRDYIQFMYIAPSLIELILKSFLEKIEGELLSITGEHFTEKTMSQIISALREDENSYLDTCILEYISYILVSKEGLNLRNNILHGNFNDYAFNKSNAMYIYIILIYLIRYFVNDESN